MPWDAALTGFGITAAALLIGGSILLRYQRDRHHFLLMKTALEKGITAFPGTTPGWLISLRVGTLAAVLGVVLIVAGILAVVTVDSIQVPQVPATPAAAPGPAKPPPPRPIADGRTDARPEPPPDDAQRPPPPSGELERWHRMEDQRAVGLGAVSAGGILVMLGIVRIVFARVERRYTGDLTPPTSS